MGAGEGGGDDGKSGGVVAVGGCGGSKGDGVAAAVPHQGTLPESAREQKDRHCGDNPSCSRCRTH